MKHGLKVCTALLALSLCLVPMASLAAEPDELSLQSSLMGAEALETLKLLETAEAVPSKEGPTFYEGLTEKQEYKDLLGKADEEFKDLQADSKEWARLSTLACDAAQKIERIDQHLSLIPTLLRKSMGLRFIGYRSEPMHPEFRSVWPEYQSYPNFQMTSVFERPLTLFAEDYQLLIRLLDENGGTREKSPVFYDPDYGKPEGEEVPKIFSRPDSEPSEDVEIPDDLVETGFAGPEAYANRKALALFKKNSDAIQALAKRVQTPAYREAVEYVRAFSETSVNETVMNLKADRMNLTALIAFAQKIGKDVGLPLAEKCALPDSVDFRRVEKEVRQDPVPRTGLVP